MYDAGYFPTGAVQPGYSPGYGYPAYGNQTTGLPAVSAAGQPADLNGMLQSLMAMLSQLYMEVGGSNQVGAGSYPAGTIGGYGQPGYGQPECWPGYGYPACEPYPNCEPYAPPVTPDFAAASQAEANLTTQDSSLSRGDQNYLYSLGCAENQIGLSGEGRARSVIDSLEQGHQTGRFTSTSEIQTMQDYYDAQYLGINSSRYSQPITSSNLPVIQQNLGNEESKLDQNDQTFLQALADSEKRQGLSGERQTRSTVEQLQQAFQEGRFHDANYVKLFEDDYDARWLNKVPAAASSTASASSALTTTSGTYTTTYRAYTSANSGTSAQQSGGSSSASTRADLSTTLANSGISFDTSSDSTGTTSP